LKLRKIIIFKLPASGTDFRNTGLLLVSAKLPIKYGQAGEIPAIWQHKRTGRHFTGGAEKICPENNNLS